MSEPTEERSPNFLLRFVRGCRNLTERDRRNSRRVNYWLLVWAVSFVAVTFGLSRDLLPGGPLTYLAIAGTSVLGLIGVLAYIRFIREADELKRKIQLEALALGFGGGFLATFTLSLIERASGAQMDLGDPFLAMVAFYVVGVVLGARRYA